eukprot:GHVH01009156.1.p1 GENE.GHVH01009156.1~~GHVH01009156.1.p1  ORF type:complete len:244 (-),score=31.43 GHVH01009156.1:57-707(-)
MLALLNAIFPVLSYSNGQPMNSRKINAVKVQLYYESLCPYCQSFIVDTLQPLAKKTDVWEHVDFNFIPFGNVRPDVNGELQCQHGANECYINTVHQCIVEDIIGFKRQFEKILCIEDKGYSSSTPPQDLAATWGECFENDAETMKLIHECVSHREEELFKKYEKMTSEVKDREFVPWVLIDGVHVNSNEFLDSICDALDDKHVHLKSCEAHEVVTH